MSKVQELVERTAREIRQNYDLLSIESALYRVIEQTQGVGVNLTPEKVRELAKFMWNNTSFTIEDYEKRITEWLGQNTIEPVVVGLSDEQVKFLADHLKNDCTRGEKMDMPRLISRWLKTQTFALPVEFSNEELVDSYQSLYEDFRKVSKELEQLKRHQFEPNWDDAPEWANWLAQNSNGQWKWFRCNPYKNNDNWYSTHNSANASESTNWQQTLQERPKPTPQVEAGQIWRCISNQQDYIVGEITTLEGETKVNNDKWEKDVSLISYRPVVACELKIYHRALSDFLAKFERVS